MTRDDIIRMALEADYPIGPLPEFLERFAKLVAAHEREECAKVCEERIEYWHRGDNRRDEDESCAAVIRARSGA